MESNPIYWQQKIEQEILADQPDGDVAHDLGHLRRVLAVARTIASEDGLPVDADVLTAAALLHDVVSLPKNHPDRHLSSKAAAAKAVVLLDGIGFPFGKLGLVRHAIEAHSFSAGIQPETTEAAILRDADRMDALGAIGIARCFAVSGSLGRALFCADDPLAGDRPLDEGAFALDHFQVKLLRLAGDMLTETGKRMAVERTAFLREFMARIDSENRGMPPVPAEAEAVREIPRLGG